MPHQEVLRTSTPVFNELNGQLSGLILITAEIFHELQKIQQVIQKSGRKFISLMTKEVIFDILTQVNLMDFI